MHETGFVMSDARPDFVVLGETRTYSFEAITRAIRLINDGASRSQSSPLPAPASIDAPVPTLSPQSAMVEGMPPPGGGIGAARARGASECRGDWSSKKPRPWDVGTKGWD